MVEVDDIFECLSQYRVLRCRHCRYAIAPAHVRTHLAQKHAAIGKADRRELVSHIACDVRLAHTLDDVVYPCAGDSPVEGFPVWYDGLQCVEPIQSGDPCGFLCRSPTAMAQHCKDNHQWTNHQTRAGDKRSQQKDSPNRIWRTGIACQQFFRVPGWRRYFEVGAIHVEPASQPPTTHRRFFDQQRSDIVQSQEDAEADANRVNAFDRHRSTVVPWLRETGIAQHLYSLKKGEIRAAIALPSADEDGLLLALTQRLEEVLRRAHTWCFDGDSCQLTWACRVALSRFQPAQVEVIGRTRAFDPYKQPKTLQTYFTTTKQLLCYVHRVAFEADHFSTDDGGRPEDVIKLTNDQRQQWEALLSLVADDDCDAAQEGLVDFLMLLICHETGAHRYRSPLPSFCAMLAISPGTGAWMDPSNFNSHLSAVIWVIQLVVFYDSARKERQGQGCTLDLVKAVCNQYLHQGVETPMGEILRWRLLLFRVSKDTVRTNEVTWDRAERVLTYQDTVLRLDDVPTLLLSEYTEAQRMLREELMFGLPEAQQMHAWALMDNHSVETVGWNFTAHRDNAHLLRGADQALLSMIERSPQLCQLYLDTRRESEDGICWRDSALASYEATVQGFLRRLCVLMHISGGQPIRENEFFSMTWQNTQRKRSVSIQHEQVMIHTQYHKMQQQTGRHRDNVRFLAPSIGELLLDYLVYVQPLRLVFARHSHPHAVGSPFLWERSSRVWPEGELSRCLEAASIRARISRLHVANWRQMTVAIVKTKFASQIHCFEPDEEDPDADEIEADIRVMTTQRNHSTRTVNMAYANQTGAVFGNVWDGLIRMGLRASTLWQDFWGVETVLCSCKRKREGMSDSRLSRRIATGVYRPRPPWAADAILGGLRQLMDNPTAEWKIPQQGQALELILRWKPEIVVILPTGAGKSILFMLPCTLPGAGITVVVVPLVALHLDLVRRIAEQDLTFLEWKPGEAREAALVLVSVEAAASKEFLQYARSLVMQQKLDRIVVDECHLTVTAARYRPSMVGFTQLRCLRTQFVYLTATLPPSMWPEFQDRNHLVHPLVVRAPSNRSNIFYFVDQIDATQGTLLEQAAREARLAWDQPQICDQSRGKIILYVQSRGDAAALADALGCAAYTGGDSLTTVEKQTVLQEWIQSPTPYIVATTALAEGFDYPHVRFVMNVGEPPSLVTFAQQVGRAGRDGAVAWSQVMLPAEWTATAPTSTLPDHGYPDTRLDPDLAQQQDRQHVCEYLEGKVCRRMVLSDHLDPAEHRRWCMVEDAGCDVCPQRHHDPPPPRHARPPSDAPAAGLDAMQRQQLHDHLELEQYREHLHAAQGTCLLCRTMARPWTHLFDQCEQRHAAIEQRQQTTRRLEAAGRKWLQRFTACYWCLNPQSVCSRAAGLGSDPRQRCAHRDMVLPACYGVYHSIDGRQWLREHFQRSFQQIEDYFDWLGQETTFGGGKAIQGVRVTAAYLRQLHPAASREQRKEIGGKEATADADEEWEF